MAYISWTEKMSTSVPDMDKQHERIVALINELHAAMTTGHGKEKIASILKDLKKYVLDHFSKEEAYMQKIGYPGLSRQKMLHEQLTQKVLGFEQRVAAGESLSSSEILEFLRNWLVEHIEHEDKKYGQHAALLETSKV